MEMEDKTLAKLIVSACLSIVPIFLGILPRYIYYKNGGMSPEWASSKVYNLALTILSCAGGGIVLGSAFFHLLPDVRDGFKAEELKYMDGTFLPEFLVLVGLAVIYIVEEIAHLIMADDGSEMVDVLEDSDNMAASLAIVARNNSITHGIPVPETPLHNFGTTSHSPSVVEANFGNSHIQFLRSYDTLRGSMRFIGEPNQTTATPPTTRSNSITVNNINSHRLRHSLLFSIAENELKRKVEESMAKPSSNNYSSNDQINAGVPHSSSSSELIKKERNHEGILKSLMALVALSVQSLMEGIAIGVQHSWPTVWMLFGTVAAHKFVVSFMMGMEMCEARARMKTFILSIIFFSILSPIGIFIGMLLAPDPDVKKSKAVVILEGLACGTLLFVVFFEILQRERERKAMSFRESKFIGFIQIFSIIGGLALMVWLINLVDGSH